MITQNKRVTHRLLGTKKYTLGASSAPFLPLAKLAAAAGVRGLRPLVLHRRKIKPCSGICEKQGCCLTLISLVPVAYTFKAEITASKILNPSPITNQ
jgi:hypothetical protein